MPIDNPRLLKEITEYKNLLIAKDSAMTVVTAALATDTSTASTPTVTTNVIMKPNAGGDNITSRDFNTYLARWIERNLATIAPEVIALMDADIQTNLAEANEEASLLGLFATPTLPPAPLITSVTAIDAEIGGTFTYEIKADNTTAAGVTSLSYNVTGNPSWLTLNQSLHTLVGTVPSTETAGDTLQVTIEVTTNGGTDSKTLTITYVTP